MDRTTEFDHSFHHRPTIPHSQHMTSQQTSNQASRQPSNQAGPTSTFEQSRTHNQGAYQPVHVDDGYIDDEVYEGAYEQPYSEETYEQPYAAQYQPGQSANQRGHAGHPRGPDQRLHSFVDSFESIN